MNIITSTNETINILSPPEIKLRVKDFYKGRNVFITGASGFMGKALVEKLLWSCEEIGNVYIMLRDKRGVPIEDRLKTLFDDQIFIRIKQRDKSIFRKVIPVRGELIEKGLGISNEDKILLQREVSVVFHGATSVKFEEPLEKAILTNIRGTRDLLDISREMENLAAFVYISTAYTNSYTKTIEEGVYTFYKDDWRSYIKMAEILKFDLNCLRNKIVDKHTNTYTFTKFLTENCVNDYREAVPVVICRPSIVSYCIDEPLPGWVGNMYGPFSVWLGISIGIIHIIPFEPKNNYDLIPCDYATNAIIVSAWYKGITNNDKCIVINLAANHTKKECPKGHFEAMLSALEKYPLENVLWFPSMYSHTNLKIYTLMFIILHMVPGIILDFVSWIQQRKFRLLPSFRKLYVTSVAIQYFAINEWNIVNKNYYKLIEFLEEDDKEIFKMDMRDFDFKKSSYVMLKGFKYILKEKDDEVSMAKARRAYRRTYIADCIFRGFLLAVFCYVVYYVLAHKSLMMFSDFLETSSMMLTR